MLRPWELNVEIARDSDTSIHVQIAQKIIDEIQTGRFIVGMALPGTRQLASKIKVNRKTVIQAYDELIAQGWLTSETKRGTFVSSRILTINAHSVDTETHHSAHRLLTQQHALPNDVTPILSKKRKMQDCIEFSDGLPDARLIPFETLSRAMRHALIVCSRQNKQSDDDARGALILREAITHMLNMERGLHAKPENICLVRSSQMGIFVIAKTLIHVGDHVIVEQLSNPNAREAFRNCGAAILNVTHDADGIDVAHIEQLCIARTQLNLNIRAVYITPHHHIPTSVTLSKSRRSKLIALAEQYDFMIIEDDEDHHFNYTKSPILPMASTQKSKHVIHLGALSKVLSSGLQVGYIVGTTEKIKQCANQVMLIDGQANEMTEFAVAELLQTGEIKKHILRTQKIYEVRKEFLSNLLKKELGEYMHFEAPASGLAFWLTIDPEIHMDKLTQDARLHKVSLQTGQIYSHADQLISGIRMGFAHLNQEEMTLGISRLKKAFSQQKINLLRA